MAAVFSISITSMPKFYFFIDFCKFEEYNIYVILYCITAPFFSFCSVYKAKEETLH